MILHKSSKKPVKPKRNYNKAKVTSAELLEFILKKKLEETGKNGKKLEEKERNKKKHRNRKKKSQKTGRNLKILKDTERNKK